MQIKKETTTLKSLFHRYNATLTIDEALDPSAVELHLGNMGCDAIATGRKREIIDAYHRLCRSTEEIDMLKEEVLNIVKYYEDRRSGILAEISYQSQDNHPFSRGIVAMLHQALDSNDRLLTQQSAWWIWILWQILLI